MLTAFHWVSCWCVDFVVVSHDARLVLLTKPNAHGCISDSWVTLVAAVTQVTLGISTLLTYVPVSLGATHQAGALTLFTIVLALLHVLRPAQPSATALLVSRLSGPAALAATAGVAAAVTQKH